MARIIAVHSFRGGTGKSNTTANLAALVALRGHRVGVIDTDIQSPGIHVIFGFAVDDLKHALNDYLFAKARIEDTAYDVTARAVSQGDQVHERTRLYLIPSSVNSGDIARVLREGYEVGLLNDGIQRLTRELQLDYVFIDTHPGINEETLLSIAICDQLLLIMRPDNQDFQGTAVTIELARRLDVRKLLLVVNKVPQGMDLDLLREQIETAYAAPVAAMLPLNSEMARLASSGLFAIRFPHHSLTQELRQLAERVME